MELEMTKGVYQRISGDGILSFRASFTFHSKHISLGSFKEKEQASLAYQEALLLVKNTDLTIEDFDEKTHLLPFEKWVSILNFRDNGLYFRTPIYLKRRFFYYYLSPHEIMKFDVDDLFYYSTHKIMRRGNHFFVSDYGMQVNLLSRYGIRNFSVPNKDYSFLNGDPLDFRYENIKIINRYFGVKLEKEFPKPVYVARINIRGSVIIGRYEDEISAAIAYNKAISLLHDAGFPKKYEENYIEGIDAPSYHLRYQTISPQKSFLKLISSLKGSKRNLPKTD